MKRVERVLNLISRNFKVEDVKELVFTANEMDYRAVVRKDIIEIYDQAEEIVNKIEFEGTYTYSFPEERIISDDKKEEKLYTE